LRGVGLNKYRKRGYWYNKSKVVTNHATCEELRIPQVQKLHILKDVSR